MKPDISLATSENEIGEVIDIKGENAVLRMESTGACDRCGAKVICRPNSSGHRIIYIRNTLNVKIGDRVSVEQNGINQVKLIFMQYGLPMICFLITIVIANRMIPNPYFGIPPEVLQFLIALVIVVLSGGLTFIWSKRMVAQRFSVFRMKSIVRAGPNS